MSALIAEYKLMSKIEVIKPVLKHQHEFITSERSYPAIIGGLGSGKSDAALGRVLHLKYKYPTLNQAWYLPTYDLINLMAMPRIEEELTKIGQPYKLNKSEYKILLENKGEIICRSMERPERIVAYQTSDAVIDEIDTLKKDKAAHVYRKISERTRSRKPDGKPNTIGIVTTPDQGLNGFVYDRYVNKATEEYHLVKARTYDNPFLPEGYIQQIKDNYDDNLAEMYLNGEFVSLNHDKVYHYFKRSRHHTDRTIKQGEPLHIGIDFNIGGCVAIVYVREVDKLIAVDEFVSKNTQEIAININARYSGHMVTLYPDASGAAGRTNASRSDIQILKDEVRTPNMPIVNAPHVNGAVRDRINSVNALLSKDRMMVNTHKCKKLTIALESQGYTDKGEPEKFDDHKGGAIDDYADAMGYPCARIFPVVRNTFTTSHR